MKERFEVQVTGYKSDIYSRWGDRGVFFDTLDEAKLSAEEYASKKGYHAKVIKHTAEEILEV